MNNYENKNMQYPSFLLIKQIKNTENISSTLKSVINDEVNKLKFKEKIKPNERIGITVGSRNINNINFILFQIGQIIKEIGGKPYIIPSMGSHGGNTIDGQMKILKDLQINENAIKIPIIEEVRTKCIGFTHENIPVHCNKSIEYIDKIIVLNRVKQHTDFSGSIESGLCKMLSIGLGGCKGAQSVHANALSLGYEKTIKSVSEYVVKKLPIICAFGILENWKNEISEFKGMYPNEIYHEESKLLVKAKNEYLKLPFNEIDLLIVNEIGKNISGTGMDTKVIGRLIILNENKLRSPTIKRIVVNDLTKESHGNATGVGHADFITKKLFSKINFEQTNLNSISSMTPEQCKIPCILNTEKEANEAAIKTIDIFNSTKAKIAYILNTSKLEYIIVSDNIQFSNEVDVIKNMFLKYDNNGKTNFHNELNNAY